MRFVLTLVLTLSFAHAAKKGGVEYSEKLSYKNKGLVLNGLGIREATWLNIDVYVAALYLENKASYGEDIIKSSETKTLTMKFVRDVKKKKIISAYEGSFKKDSVNKYIQNELGNKSVAEFLAQMTDMKEGSTMTLGFHNNEVELSFNGKAITVIKDANFTKALLAVWLGDSPPNKGLKTGLLGQN